MTTDMIPVPTHSDGTPRGGHTNGAMAPAEEPRRFVDRLLTSKRADIETALAASGAGSAVDFDLFRLGIARAIMKEPRLEKASPVSLAGAVLDCARLGLVPAGYDAQAALITRGSDASLMVMVGGLIDMVLRGGRVIEIGAETVKQGETFERDPIADTIRHVVTYPRPKPIVAAYAWAKMNDGTRVFEIVDKDEIDSARKAGSGGGAWTTWEGEMAKKVAKRRLVRARRLISLKALGAVEGSVEVEGDREEIEEMLIAETRPSAREATLAVVAGAAPLAITAGAPAVLAEARLAQHDAEEDARLERLRAQAQQQPAPKMTPKQISEAVESVRARLAELVRLDEETPEAARARAVEALGKVGASNFEAWHARGLALIAEREEPRDPAND